MEIKVNEDRTMTLRIDGTYTAQEVRELLEKISAARQPIADDPTSVIGLNLLAGLGAAWYVQPMESGDSALFFRHPGIGWTGFTLLPVDRCRLAATLCNQQAEFLSAGANPYGAGRLST